MMKTLIFCLFIILVKLIYGDQTCDFRGTLIYEELGCKPIFEVGLACPIEYNCNFEVKNNQCTYKGNHLNIFDKVNNDDINGACAVNCTCASTDNFRCTFLDCPEDSTGDLQDGCYKQYDVKECCSVNLKCLTEGTEPAFECVVEDVTYKEGQRFTPRHTCYDCVCNKGFEGKFEEPFCSRAVCASEIQFGQMIHSYCAPYYENQGNSLCCPNRWVCPTAKDIHLSADINVDKSLMNLDLSCKFGDKILKLGERILGHYRWYDGKNRPCICECVVPPLLTCT